MEKWITAIKPNEGDIFNLDNLSISDNLNLVNNFKNFSTLLSSIFLQN